MLKLLTAIFLIFPMAATAAEIKMVEQFSEGGVALVVILLMSILLVAVSAERLVNFRAKTIFSSDLIARVKPLWLVGDFDKIHKLLESEKNTLGRILNYLLCHRYQQVSVLALGASDIASLELRQHQQKAYALAIVATPEASANLNSSATVEKVVAISVDKKGGLFLQGEPISITKLQDHLKYVSAENQQTLIELAGDERVSYKHIISVIDVCQFEGLTNIALQTRNK